MENLPEKLLCYQVSRLPPLEEFVSMVYNKRDF